MNSIVDNHRDIEDHVEPLVNNSAICPDQWIMRASNPDELVEAVDCFRKQCGTKITDVFGTHLRPMIEFIGWIYKIEDGSANIVKVNYSDRFHPDEMSSAMTGVIKKAHDLLTRTLEEKYFVRPEKPEKGIYDLPQLKAYETWRPLFKGEWKLINIEEGNNAIFFNGDFIGCYPNETSDGIPIQNINDFATHCLKKNISLELNENFEI